MRRFLFTACKIKSKREKLIITCKGLHFNWGVGEAGYHATLSRWSSWVRSPYVPQKYFIKFMFKCKYCGKEFDSGAKLGGHIGWCENNPNKRSKNELQHIREKAILQRQLKPIDNEIECKYCGKICKLYGIKNHERQCKFNPNRIPQKGTRFKINDDKFIPWNKGLTKEIDIRIKNQAEKISNSYKEGKIKIWCDGLTKENDKRLLKMSNKISDTVLNNVKNDNWHNSFGKSKLVEYKGIQFHGNWEVAFAKFLDNINIIWERPTEKFEYILDNKTHYYTPDFYLPVFNLYIEIKGYPTNKDFLKWSQFPKDKKLDIYFGDDLSNLGIINDYKDVYNNIDNKFREKNVKLFEK